MPQFDYAEAEMLIEAVDPAIFRLETETELGDRRMLLGLQNVVRRAKSDYCYIEIGSYMGGTLVPHLMDRRCSRAISIDKRPDIQRDERSITFDYTRSSTALMLERLEQNLPFSALLKLSTHDCDASEVPPAARAVRIDLGFIDGEHTNRAAFQDFLSLYRFAAPDCIIAFHDANLIGDALASVESFLRFERIEFEGLVLPDVLYAVFIGRYAPLAAPFQRHALDKEEFFRTAKEMLWNTIAASRSAK